MAFDKLNDLVGQRISLLPVDVLLDKFDRRFRKQQIPSVAYQTPKTPNIDGCAPRRAKHDFRSSKVLWLNIVA